MVQQWQCERKMSDEQEPESDALYTTKASQMHIRLRCRYFSALDIGQSILVQAHVGVSTNAVDYCGPEDFHVGKRLVEMTLLYP